ncbi:MAG TPA: hypothetical protein VFE57_09620 [Cyclobacteriaceae bacterium]|jgi:hypothetical protein|nr:hypothetical protein [Cyclobacteriaceae bacterium]
MTNRSSVSDYTDRELIEMAASKAKEAADNSKWVKNYIIIVSIAAFVYCAFITIVSFM